MAITNFNHRELIYIFGILGNIVSFGVFLSPMPTFWRIYKKKSTEGFQALPYSVALFSATLLLYYAMIKKDDATLIITINIIGFVIELFYLSVFLIYAPKWARAYTLRLLGLLNVTCLAMIIFTTLVFTHGDDEHTLLSKGGVRESTVGWICAVFSVCVFAAPLSVMRMVIRTKSAEFMPFWLSFSLTLCAVMWFFYGFLIKDFYIAFPNILGFILGITQMILYIIYKGSSTTKQPNDLVIDIKLGNVAKINQELTLENKENVAQEVIEIIVQELEILEEKSEENSNNSNNNDNDNEKNDKVANIGDIIVADMSRTESNV